MKKIVLVLLLVSTILFSGCLDDFGGKPKIVFKGMDDVRVPEECADVKDDVCGLFSCMVDLCWCKEGPDMILYEPNTDVSSNTEATQLVMTYISENSLNLTVTNSVQLNTVFYNVFAEDSSGNEEVFTVAADGTIIQTICGV
ncbi:MAG: hypothetical protein V1672_04190 [Candidatus Diapherotrites archaeon]